MTTFVPLVSASGSHQYVLCVVDVPAVGEDDIVSKFLAGPIALL